MRRIRLAAANLAKAESDEIKRLRVEIADYRYALCLIANGGESDPRYWARDLAASTLRSHR